MGTSPAERENIARAARLFCPVCSNPLPRPVGTNPARTLHHSRECIVCGAVVLFPRVALVKALARSLRKGR